MRRLPVAAAVALALSRPLEAGVEVTSSGPHLDVIATQAPVSEVLEGLARKTRMKVVYEGPVPRVPVTVEIRGRTPAQAVLGVLEGLGLNYALTLDATGAEVETLMIVGSAGAAPSTAQARAARPNRRESRAPDPEDAVEREEPTEMEANAPAVATEVTPTVAPEVQKVQETAKPALPVPGPLNPITAFPRGSPFAPGVPLIATPSPGPNQQPVPNQQPGPNQQPVPNQ